MSHLMIKKYFSHLDLTNSISDPDVEICLFYDVDQGALGLPSSGGCHGVIRPHHCHLRTAKRLK